MSLPMTPLSMHLRILLPFEVFDDVSQVRRIVADTSEGSFGLLPRRRDGVAALVPGVLLYDSVDSGEVFVAIDEGVLVKTGAEVTVSVRGAIRGPDLEGLHDAVAREFLKRDALHESMRAAMARLEGSFLKRLAGLEHD